MIHIGPGSAGRNTDWASAAWQRCRAGSGPCIGCWCWLSRPSFAGWTLRLRSGQAQRSPVPTRASVRAERPSTIPKSGIALPWLDSLIMQALARYCHHAIVMTLCSTWNISSANHWADLFEISRRRTWPFHIHNPERSITGTTTNRTREAYFGISSNGL